MDGQGRRKYRYHQNELTTAAPNEIRDGKIGKENCINGSEWGRNLNSLLHMKAGKEGIRKSPIEFVPVLEKAKGISNRSSHSRKKN